jgi:SET domain
MYCSTSCKKQHLQLIHQFTCSKISVPVVEVCTKMLMKGVQVCDNFESFDDLAKNPKRQTIFDFPEQNEKSFISIINSCAMSEHSKISISEKMKAIFNHRPYSDLWSTADERENVINSFHRQLRVLNTNLLEMGEHVYESGAWYAKTIGSGLCPFASLFNHSCDPNVSRVTFNNKIVFIVSRPVKSGDQLFISYGYSFPRMSREQRHQSLARYGFKCDCIACVEDYPLLKDLPRINQNFVQPNFEFYNQNTAINQFRQNCSAIEASSIHPSFETTLLMIHNEHLMYQIAKAELEK